MSLKDYSYEKQLYSSMYNDVVYACGELLKKSKFAVKEYEYVKSRVSKRNIDKFEVGYFPTLDNISELTKFVNEDILYKLGLIYNSNHFDGNNILLRKKNLLQYHNTIFPYRDEYGNIIGVSGRTLLNEGDMKEIGIGKYKNTSFNKSQNLFGLYFAKQSILSNGYAILVEGQIDCISCHERGVYNVVAVTGSDLSRYQFYLLKKYTNNLCLLFDNDEAGENGFNKAIKIYSNHANLIRRVNYPDIYEDVDDYMRKCGDTTIFNNFGEV
jgi:DNA primase